MRCYEQCIECGAEAEHRHHVVPRSKGGSATVPLCKICHAKAHGIKLKDLIVRGKILAKRNATKAPMAKREDTARTSYSDAFRHTLEVSIEAKVGFAVEFYLIHLDDEKSCQIMTRLPESSIAGDFFAWHLRRKRQRFPDTADGYSQAAREFVESWKEYAHG
jgi:hypothetical protein